MHRRCSHSFSWPIRASDGRYYRTCRLCGSKHEFDWQKMCGIGQGSSFTDPFLIRPVDAPSLKLLPSRESAFRTFAENLTFCFRSQPRVVAGYRPGTLWRNVFVPSGAPWRWFGRSLICHAVAIIIMAAALRPSKVTARHPEIFPNSQITYYRPSTFPAREAQPSVSFHRPAARSAVRAQAAIRVAPGSNHAALIAPQIKLPHSSLPNLALGKSLVAPSLPSSALSQFHLKGAPGGQLSAVGPAPELHGNLRGSLSLSQGPVVGPPSNLAGIPSQRKWSAPGSSVVAPVPSMQGLRRSGNSISIGNSSVVAPAPQVASVGRNPYGQPGAPTLGGSGDVVAPAPQVAAVGGNPYRKAGAPTFNGSGDVVAPAPQVAGALSIGKGQLPQSEIVAPAPSLNDFRSGAVNGGAGNFGVGFVPIVPPAPQLSGMGGGSGQRTGTPGMGLQAGSVVGPPPSLPGSGMTGSGTSASGANSGVPDRGLQVAAAPPVQQNPGTSSELKPPAQLPAPETIDNSPPGSVHEFSLHLVGLASALPTSSYFSNYEVFIAERRLTKLQSQFIKLVYMFLPYQRRLSEYGSTTLRNLKLRVRRDPTCDESLLDMTWPDAATRPQPPDPNSSSKSSMLPCYRTSADDYRRALAKNRE